MEQQQQQQPALEAHRRMLAEGSGERASGDELSAESEPEGAPERAPEVARPVQRPSQAPGPQRQGLQQRQQKLDYDEVKEVELFGVRIVALIINGRERLCLAQISNTLLKEFSYNEIHNRRVALGITCIQCTPIQLEMLRRSGAMPSSSRRCGMITMREAERLCRSFLVEEQPPELPENFYFTVAHRVNYGCKGRFVPARYISSRAKCIECFYCGEFYSPNKFIFHSHRQPMALDQDCHPPDSPNINSWRKHIDLDWAQEHSQEIKYAWEDVKSLFNGGTRRRTPAAAAAAASLGAPEAPPPGRNKLERTGVGDELLLVDVEAEPEPDVDVDDSTASAGSEAPRWRPRPVSLVVGALKPEPRGPAPPPQPVKRPAPGHAYPLSAAARRLPQCSLGPGSARLCLGPGASHQASLPAQLGCPRPAPAAPPAPPFAEYAARRPQLSDPAAPTKQPPPQSLYPTSSNFIYSQLYAQLMQQHQHQQPALEAQLALRHHLWTSLLANLQTAGASSNLQAAAQDSYLEGAANGAHLGQEPVVLQVRPPSGAGHLQQQPASHLISTSHFYQQQQQQPQQQQQDQEQQLAGGKMRRLDPYKAPHFRQPSSNGLDQ